MPTINSLVSILSAVILSLFPNPKTHISHALHTYLSPTPTTTSATPTPTTILHTPTPQTSSPNTALSKFLYPKATTVSQSMESMTLSTQDDPNTIIAWYKDIFSQVQMRSTAISMSTTNNTISDKLAGDTGSVQVEIGIQRNANDSTSIITVTIASSSGNMNIQNSNVY